ncbi:MAG TPA: YicC family protein [Ruminococcus sp.]|nr:YicC family protein [Ruminococcus sp.]HBN11842.1 YicC family protein [Ruminococcus sp.]HCR74143.1 YicC family protein [Ruminococcus sp.]
MIRSMTGYGREQDTADKRTILVEIRSVNHRYYEFSSRIPRAYAYLDEKLKAFVNKRVSRGKVEVSVSIVNSEGSDIFIEVNRPVALGYINALRSANEELQLRDDLSLSQICKFSDIFSVQKTVDDEEEVWKAVETVAGRALEKFIAMREKEGQKMKEDILSRLSTLENMVCFIEKNAPLMTENYRNRLYNRLMDILQDKNIDEQRILTEAAIYSEKVAVDEETVRLHSHISQFRELLESDNQVGRKLDFLVQEMNREVNTTGSKAQDLDITRTVVEMKSEIEKIREQIQNIE